MDINEIKKAFDADFIAKYGGGVQKTVWHFFNWFCIRRGIGDKVRHIKLLSGRFEEHCSVNNWKRSYENAIRWISKETEGGAK